MELRSWGSPPHPHAAKGRKVAALRRRLGRGVGSGPWCGPTRTAGPGWPQSERWRAAASWTPDKPRRSRGGRRRPAGSLRRQAPGRRIDTGRSCRQPALQAPEQRCGRGPPDSRTGNPSDHTRHPVQVGEEGGEGLARGNRNGRVCPAASSAGGGRCHVRPGRHVHISPMSHLFAAGLARTP
jgi:hypothetical protein